MTVRPAALAGTFYPADGDALRRVVESHVGRSGVEPAAGTVAALVVPHAGYAYSGATAGCGYARVRGKRPGRIVLLGCSHRHRFPGVSLWPEGGYATPLGVAPVDEAFTARLAAVFGTTPPEPHGEENALETQVPFLQCLFAGTPMVPVLFGEGADEWHTEFGRTLAGMIDADDLVIASMDLSHYLTEEAANEMDGVTLDALLSGEPALLLGRLRRERNGMCGGAAVAAAVACAAARGAGRGMLLEYATSARAGGGTGRVVGYAAVSFEVYNAEARP